MCVPHLISFSSMFTVSISIYILITLKSLSPLPMSLLSDQIFYLQMPALYLHQIFHRHLKSNMSQNKCIIY